MRAVAKITIIFKKLSCEFIIFVPDLTNRVFIWQLLEKEL